MKIIGLTGGIGSGKSTVARLFESYGVPLYYADKEAKDLMNTSQTLRIDLINLFGEKAFLNNTLNRAYIADIVFNDKKKLTALNSIVHPEVKKHFLTWVGLQEAPYVIQENPLIFEKNEQTNFDKTILVVADENQRIQRVMERDQTSREKVLDRISNQLADKEKINLADFVIYNNLRSETELQVNKLHRELFEQFS